jgi:polyhydroxyalkanoate synthase
MSKPTETLDRARAEWDRHWSRVEAAANYLAHPPAAQVGQTPKEVVWTKNKAKLYRYHSENRRHAVPLLLVYAMINRPYIMDLTPGNSLVEFLLGEGYDVFLLDWGVPGPEDEELGFDHYVLDYIARATKQVLKVSGAEEFSIIGYCMGGSMSVMYAALHPEAPLRNLVLMATPVDFSQAGLFTNWLNPEHFDVDRLVDTLGNVPAHMIDTGSKLLKPLQNYVGPYVTLYDRLHDERFVEGWQVMNTWVNDGIPFTGAAYRQWIKDLYQQNKLVAGTFELRGRQVDLQNIRCPILNVVAEQDHIALPCQSEPLREHVGSQDFDLLPVKAGHVGLVAGRGAREKFFPRLDAWLSVRSN